MARYTTETQDWLDRAQAGERPFSFAFEHGALVLGFVRGGDRGIADHVQEGGYACFRAVSTVRRRKLSLTVSSVHGRVRLDEDEPSVRNGVSKFSLALPAPHPDAATYADKDFSCRFGVVNAGEEEVAGEGVSGRVKLGARFFATARAPSPSIAIEKVDALFVTALEDEEAALVRVGEDLGVRWSEEVDSAGIPFMRGECDHDHGRRTFVLVRGTRMGETSATSVASRMMAELKGRGVTPSCIAMPGICAGRRGHVSLGDVVVADRLWKFDEGAIERVRKGESVEERVLYDTVTYNLRPRVKRHVEQFRRHWDDSVRAKRPKTLEQQMLWLLATMEQYESGMGEAPGDHVDRHRECASWETVIKYARKRRLIGARELRLLRAGRNWLATQRVAGRDRERPRVHIGPIGTNAFVRRDEMLFEALQDVMRKIKAIEMEGAAVGQVAQEAEVPHLVVKASVDFADFEKDDGFREYSSELSAKFLVSFLLERGRDAGLLD